MADRKNFYDSQKVTEAELDGAFDSIEAAIDRVYDDIDITGIVFGANVVEQTPTPNFTVNAEAGVVIDQTGQRIRWTSTQVVDLTLDENGVSTAISGSPAEKYLSIFAEFIRVESDPRVDGSQSTVFFESAESFKLNVVQGAEAGIGLAVPPALRSNQRLLCDILFNDSDTDIQTANIEFDRREYAYRVTAAAGDITGERITDVLDSLSSAIDGTNAISISNTWHDGSGIAATDVEAGIEEIVGDLADESTIGNGGADRIGTRAKTVGGITLAAGSVDDQLVAILGEIQALKRDRAYMQVTSMYKLKEVLDADVGGADVWALSFSTNENGILTASRPVVMVVGFNSTGPVGKVVTLDDFLAPTDVTSNLINAPDKLQDAVYIPNSNRHIVVGRIDASSGADIETCDDEVGTAWTSRTPTGMTSAGDEAYTIVYDSSNSAVIVAGNNGNIARSIDDGASWAVPTTVPGGLTTYNWVYGVANNVGDVLLVGRDGSNGDRVLHSDDGGDTWTDVSPSGFTSFNNLVNEPVWEPVSQKFLVSTQARNWRSNDDSGTTWTEVARLSQNPHSRVTDADSGVIFGLQTASGAAGAAKLLATEDLGVTWKVSSHIENNPEGATHSTVSGWEDGMPGTSTNSAADSRKYFAAGRFWVAERGSLWVSPARTFAAIHEPLP